MASEKKQSPGAVKAGEIIKPAGYYRFVPLGIVSGAIWGLQFISLCFVLMGLSKMPLSDFTATFQGEGLRIWLVCGLVWIGLLVFNLGLGSLIARRRFELTPEGVVIHGPFGGRREVSRRNAAHVRTYRSVAAMMQGGIHIRYADGSKAGIDGAGLDGNALGRLSAWIAKG